LKKNIIYQRIGRNNAVGRDLNQMAIRGKPVQNTIPQTPPVIASHDEQGVPRWLPQNTFPPKPMQGMVIGTSSSIDNTNPSKGSIVNLRLSPMGIVIEGEVLDYFLMAVPDKDEPVEHVQIRVGPNIYLRPSSYIVK
jgi:hypothetical protein